VSSDGDIRRPRETIVERLLSAEHSRGGGRSRGRKRQGLFTEAEVSELEGDHAEGVTAAEVVEMFSERGIRLSEATFRKYVQRGLLPRSRRVGRKGKHRGSLGVYPAKTIGRVNAIKRLMDEGFTIEEIQGGYFRYTDLIEELSEKVDDLFAQLDEDLTGADFDTKARRNTTRDIAEARKTADDLLRRVGELSERLSGSPTPDLGPAGAAGSAEDLL
jgi:DNA-binding transcriptional MerR regulator